MLVQLDDDLVAALDELAAAEGVSRSQLLRRGASAILAAATELEDERKFNESYAKNPQDPAEDAAYNALAVEVLKDLPF